MKIVTAALFAALMTGGGLAVPRTASASAPIWPSAQASPADPASTVSFSVILPLQNESDLRALLSAQQDPTSLSYHQWLSPDDINARFGASPASLGNVTSTMQSLGFQLISSEGRLLKFSGTAAAVDATFSANLISVRMQNGSTHLVAGNAIQMPAGLSFAGAVVTAFSGLPRLHTNSMVVSNVDPENRYAANGPYWFTDLKQAYDYPSYTSTLANGQRPDGTGVQVAVLISNDIRDSDVIAMFNHEKFTSQGGVLPSAVARVNINGGAPFNVNASFEASLDVQQVLGGAPGASVTLVNLPDLSDANIVDGYNYIVNAKSGSGTALYQLVNSSFGGCESAYTASYNQGVDYTYLLAAYESLFEQGNAEGITFVASSGDEGGLECPEAKYFYGAATARFTPSVSFPAASPSVTAVGGGNLLTSADGTLKSAYTSENALGDPEIPYDPYGVGVKVSGGYWGPGGGVSAVYAKPAYQALVSTGTTAARTLPDVGMQVGGCPGGISVLPCGPNRSAVAVYVGGSAFGVIGTSVASPEFVSALALYVQKTGPIGNANYFLYAQAHAQNSGLGTYYHRVSTGFDGKYTDKVPTGGYNYLVGNGTPYVRSLFGFLNQPAAGIPQTPSNP